MISPRWVPISLVVLGVPLLLITQPLATAISLTIIGLGICLAVNLCERVWGLEHVPLIRQLPEVNWSAVARMEHGVFEHDDNTKYACLVCKNDWYWSKTEEDPNWTFRNGNMSSREWFSNRRGNTITDRTYLNSEDLKQIKKANQIKMEEWRNAEDALYEVRIKRLRREMTEYFS